MAPTTTFAACTSGRRAVAATLPSVLPRESSVPVSWFIFIWKPCMASRATFVAPLVFAMVVVILRISSSL